MTDQTASNAAVGKVIKVENVGLLLDVSAKVSCTRRKSTCAAAAAAVAPPIPTLGPILPVKVSPSQLTIPVPALAFTRAHTQDAGSRL